MISMIRVIKMIINYDAHGNQDDLDDQDDDPDNQDDQDFRMIKHRGVQRQDRALWLDDQTFLRSTRI